MENDIKIRIAEHLDLASIVDIYNQAIRSKCATGDTEEFNMVDRMEWFKKFDNNNYPIYIAEKDNKVLGYCTISPYRPGRKAMASVAEIAYYIDYKTHGKGIGSALVKYAIEDASRIHKKSFIAILLDINEASVKVLKKFNFSKWGHLPGIIELDGKDCGHLIYGLKL